VTAACAPADEDGPAAKESAAQSQSPTHGATGVNEATLNLVAEVKKGSYSLQLFEPEPGLLMEVERGRASMDSLGPDVDMLTKYKFVSGANPPHRLVEAHARLQALRASRPAAKLEGDVAELEEELEVTSAHAGQEKERTWGIEAVSRDRAPEGALRRPSARAKPAHPSALAGGHACASQSRARSRSMPGEATTW
jgi:hypothetical protein